MGSGVGPGKGSQAGYLDDEEGGGYGYGSQGGGEYSTGFGRFDGKLTSTFKGIARGLVSFRAFLVT